jgi:hypothetical protein
MKIITTREIRNETKAFFELAEKERIAVKRGNRYVNLIVTEEPNTVFVSENWVKEFLDIPAEYRVNPFNISPSGDLFFADKRNIDSIDKAIQDVKEGKVTAMKKGQSIKDFLDELCIK